MNSTATKGLLLLCLLALLPLPPLQAQTPEATDDPVAAIIAGLSPEQRVSQLLVLSFQGTTPPNDFLQLLESYPLGGVMLSAEQENLQSAAQVSELSASLQSRNLAAAEAANRPPLPLLIASRHPQPLEGLNPLPSPMAIAATWDMGFAQQVGEMAGAEAAALGINLLLEPTLHMPLLPEGARLLGGDTFGSQPAWVGRMAAAYAMGLHMGSDGRVAAVGRGLPGMGAADRDPRLQIPTLQRSLQDLQQFELLPGFAVTGGAEGASQVRGLQCANLHLAQGSRRNARPLCLEPEGLNTLLRDARYGNWAQQGGLLLSPALGTPGVAAWYGGLPFPHRQVARDALLAGNDLLLLVNTDSALFSPQNVADLIEFFARGYRTDTFFRARVDRALAKILRLKLALYAEDFTLANLTTWRGEVPARRFVEDAAAAITLLAPAIEQLPPPPQSGESLAIVTACTRCRLSADALEAALLNFYGGESTQQLRAADIESLRASEMGAAQEQLRAAQWVIFLLYDDAAPLREYLAQRPRGQRVVVLGMESPYLLSATDIRQLAAYIMVYDDDPAFLEAAARALMQDVPFTGALPVSLPAINYDVMAATAPDPTRNMELQVLDETGTALPANSVLEAGASIQVRTGPLLDRAGRSVPDGFPVSFRLQRGDGGQIVQEATVQGGSASAVFVLATGGQAEISAQAGSARTRRPLVLAVRPVLVAAPSAETTATPNLTATAQLAATSAALNATTVARSTQIAATLAPLGETPALESEPGERRPFVSIGDFFLSLLGLLLLVLPAFVAGWASLRSLDGSLRIVLGMVVAGLTGYIYYGIGAPGAHILQFALGDLAATTVSFVAGLAGLVFTWWTVRTIPEGGEFDAD